MEQSIILNDICSLITKQTGFDYSETIKPSLINENKEKTLPYIQTKFFEGKSFNFNTDFYIPINVANQFPKLLLNKKCILLSIVGSIGNVGLYCFEKVSFLGGAICIIVPKNEKDILPLYYFLNSNLGLNQLKDLTKEGVQPTVTIDDIRQIRIPHFTEQQISNCNFLSNLDSMIDLTKNKCKKLENIKISLINSMFIKGYSGTPKMRFNSCDKNLEKCKLGDIADVLTGGEPPSDSIKSKNGYDAYKYPIYSNGLGANAIWGWAKIYRISVPAITFSSIGSLGCPSIRAPFFTPVIRLKVIIPKSSKFSLSYLKYNLDICDFANNASGIPNINADAVKDIDLNITLDYKEQEKIGNLFLKLDELINCYKMKYDKLEKIKKSLLNKTFS